MNNNASSIPPATAVVLDDLVEYGNGSVVSRTIVKNAAGTLTLFAFDEGEGLSEHTAPFDALVLILEGEADLTIGSKTVKANNGQSVLMPANVPHALKASKPFKMLLVMIRG